LLNERTNGIHIADLSRAVQLKTEVILGILCQCREIPT